MLGPIYACLIEWYLLTKSIYRNLKKKSILFSFLMNSTQFWECIGHGLTWSFKCKIWQFKGASLAFRGVSKSMTSWKLSLSKGYLYEV